MFLLLHQICSSICSPNTHGRRFHSSRVQYWPHGPGIHWHRLRWPHTEWAWLHPAHTGQRCSPWSNSEDMHSCWVTNSHIKTGNCFFISEYACVCLCLTLGLTLRWHTANGPFLSRRMPQYPELSYSSCSSSSHPGMVVLGFLLHLSMQTVS